MQALVLIFIYFIKHYVYKIDNIQCYDSFYNQYDYILFY